MSDVKTVKVDNWGSFFLQKLQNFFNKTDYCDMTLQFRDNSQLKVHRLVLSACTDYFNILESTSESMDDVLLMPRDLQADVVVPIVNFMYTGTLEFEVRMYERLLKTARDMKMSVLLKLLEAHRRAMPKQAPIVLNRGVASRPAMRGGGYTSTRGRPAAYRPLSSTATLYKKSLNNSLEETEDVVGSDFERLRRAGNENPTGKRPSSSISTRSTSPLQKKPNLQDVKEYTEAARLRKQLNEDGEDEVVGDYDVDDTYSQSSGEEGGTPRQSMSLLSTSAGSNANKSARASLDASSPAGSSSNTTTATVTIQETPGQKMDHAKIISEVMKKYPHLLKSNKNIKLKITQKTPGASGTSFTVRAETTSGPVTNTPAPKPVNTNTTPVGRALMASKQQSIMHGVRGGKVATASRSLVAPSAAKNVVVPAANSSSSSSIIKPQASTSSAAPPPPSTPAMKGNRIDSRTMHRLIAMGAENMEGPWLCLRCGVDGKPIGIPTYRAFRKHLINTHQEKIDPRLCEHCGHRSRNRQEMYHHVQVKHAIMPPQGVAFPACKTCKFVAVDNNALSKHEQEKKHGSHAVVPAAAKGSNVSAADDFSCQQCDRVFLNRKALTMHINVKHRGIRQGRRVKRASSEEEEEEEETEEEEGDEEVEEDADQVDFDRALAEDVDYVPRKAEARKIKILSNVAVKGVKSRSSEADSLSACATGIATSLGLGDESADNSAEMEFDEGEEIVDETRLIEEALANVHGVKQEEESEVVTKFLAEDGTELQLSAAQKAELMSQLESNGGDEEEVVMMYDGEEPAAVTSAETSAQDEELMTEAVATSAPGQVIKDGDEVLMVYGGPRSKSSKPVVVEPVEEAVKDGKKIDEEGEEAQPMEQSMEEESVAVISKTPEAEEEEEEDDEEDKIEKEKNSLIKELEGDWTDDGEEKVDGGDDKKAEAKESKVEVVKKDEVEEKKDVSVEEKVEEDVKTEELSKDEETIVKEELKTPVKGSGAEPKKDSALAEFMDDWDDEN